MFVYEASGYGGPILLSGRSEAGVVRDAWRWWSRPGNRTRLLMAVLRDDPVRFIVLGPQPILPGVSVVRGASLGIGFGVMREEGKGDDRVVYAVLEALGWARPVEVRSSSLVVPPENLRKFLQLC